MNSQPENNIGKLDIVKRLRLSSYAWTILVGATLLVGFTFAWYTLQKREAVTESNNVMKPYYLNLSNPDETSALQLSIGSLLHGTTKQIVFCVNTDEEQQINTDTTTFAYDLELIHTDNLPLEYNIYKISTLEDDELDEPLEWKDVSAERHAQVGLIASADQESTAENIINRGTYMSYGKTDTIDNGLELTVGGTDGAYTSQYFVLEIKWQDLDANDSYSNYDKETDMIYLLAKILQPEPEPISQ